jgi:sugar-specific transcriptional regulator TrmB
MSHANLVEMLKKAGFTENEAKCYLALLERDSLSVNEVAKLSGIVRPSAYDVLEKLLSNGFVAIVPGNIKRYAALEPWILKEKSLKLIKESTTLELEEFKKRQHVLLEKKMEELSEREEAAKSSIDKLVKMLEPIFNKSRDKNNPLDYIEVLKNPEHSQRKYMQLYSQAKTEIIAFTRSPFFLDTKKIREKHKKDIRAAAKRGVKVRSIHEIPESDAERKELYKNIKGYSDELQNNIVRVIKKLPTKMVVFDNQTVLFTLNDPIQSVLSTTCLVAEHQELASGFKELFETYWEKAQDFEILNNRECFTLKK